VPEYRDQRFVPYTPQQVFDVVLDIDRYQEFLPWCVASEVLDVYPEENKLFASVTAGYALYGETYVSKVTFKKYNWIEARYIEGPFEHLETRWILTPQPQGCLLEFYVSFAFKKGLMNTLASHMMDQVSTKMVKAFVQRVFEIYPQQV
jgi:coenzyme Q-binding protein COQ10